MGDHRLLSQTYNELRVVRGTGWWSSVVPWSYIEDQSFRVHESQGYGNAHKFRRIARVHVPQKRSSCGGSRRLSPVFTHILCGVLCVLCVLCGVHKQKKYHHDEPQAYTTLCPPAHRWQLSPAGHPSAARRTLQFARVGTRIVPHGIAMRVPIAHTSTFGKPCRVEWHPFTPETGVGARDHLYC